MRINIVILMIFMTLGCENNSNRSNSNSVTNKNTELAANDSTDAPPVYTYEIVNVFKHDSKAFTQGLIFHKGFLYESTGELGRSSIRKVELESGKVVQKVDLADNFFAEGTTIFDDKIYQLTWRDGKAFVYDLENLKVIKEFNFQGEGWGLTNDGKQLVMSDGTHILKFIDPETFKVIRMIPVMKDGNQPLFLLNELEFVNGEIWANIWHSEQTETGTYQGRLPNIGKPNYIARIDPANGKVIGWIDLDKISPEDSRESENTLNGIAYDAAGDRLFVTGKNWKKLFEIKLKKK